MDCFWNDNGSMTEWKNVLTNVLNNRKLNRFVLHGLHRRQIVPAKGRVKTQGLKVKGF